MNLLDGARASGERTFLARAASFALAVSATCLALLCVMPPGARASDVALTINPTVGTYGSGRVILDGTVSCSSTTLDGYAVTARIQQGNVVTPSSIGFAYCYPGSDGYWQAFFETSLLHPGSASATVQIALSDGSTVSATGSIRLINKSVSSTRHIDDSYFDSDLSAACGVPVEAHDVGLLQSFAFLRTGKEQFVGTTTYTNRDSGASVVVETSARFVNSATQSAFTGLNYRIRTSSGIIVSSGRGVLSIEGETLTPHLTHVFPVLCALLV